MKLKISQKQYNSILLHEKQERLKGSDSTIIEETTQTSQILNEGWKDVVLGIALMLGVNLTGQNKTMADKAISNESVMKEIKATLEDENKLDNLVDALKEKGMETPEKKLGVSPETLVYDYNKKAKENKINSVIGIKAALALNSLKK